MDVISYILGKNAGGGGGSATLQNNKNVNITSNGTTVVNPDSGYDAVKKVTATVNVQPTLQNKNVTITSNTTTTLQKDSGYDGLGIVEVTTNVTPNLQNKSLTITENKTTTIEKDSGYDGLGTVTVTTNVSGGTTPTKGYVINSWNANGYPTDITTYGYTIIWDYLFSNPATNYGNFVELTNITLNNGIAQITTNAFKNCGKLTSILFPNSLTRIRNSAFLNCSHLALTSLPSTITEIEDYAFENCTNLAITTIPDGVTQVVQNTFKNCTNIKKLSMNNIAYINGNSSTNGTFIGCTGLKQVWIGSAIQGKWFYRYSFNGCTNLEKMYIDLPRATVEAFTNYQYAFMNDTSKTGIIICNDDAGFIDKATFDALVIN